MVTVINSDEEFPPAFQAAGGALIVIDFTASWCGPCRAIAPEFERLAGEYPEAKFLKVDVDKCPGTAQTYQIEAMPTFVFVRNRQTLCTVRGANKQALENKIAELVGERGGGTSAEEQQFGIPGMIDLAPHINMGQSNCLNEDDDHPLKYALEQENKDLFLQSDCDPELLIFVEFNQPVKLHSIKILGHTPENSPSSAKIFINQPHNMDFDSARDSTPVQEIKLPKESDDGIAPLRFVKFQNVSNVTLFIPGNHGDEEETQISRLVFIGKTVSVTNMAEFKRVAGKKGESH